MKTYVKVFATLLIAMYLSSASVEANDKISAGYQNSAIIDNGHIFVAGNNQYKSFGDLVTTNNALVEYGNYTDAISVVTDGYRIVVLTEAGTLSIQGLWIDDMEVMANDVVDFALTFKYLYVLHTDKTLSRIELDRQSVNTVSNVFLPSEIEMLDGSFNTYIALSIDGDLYVNGIFLTSDVEMVEVAKTTSVYKLFDGTIKVLNNNTLTAETLTIDSNIINVSVGDSNDIYLHYEDGVTKAKGWHNIIDNTVYNNSSTLEEVGELYGVDSVQSSQSHRLATINKDVYSWAQNAHGEQGISTDTIETHSLGYVTTVVDLQAMALTISNEECQPHNNGKNVNGNTVDYCKTGFVKGHQGHKK